MDEWPTELRFEFLNGFRQRRLRYIAIICRAGEIQRLRKSKEVTNLMKLHTTPLHRRCGKTQCPSSFRTQGNAGLLFDDIGPGAPQPSRAIVTYRESIDGIKVLER